MARAVLTTVVMDDDQLPAIDPAHLEAVTGGVTSGGNDPNQQVTLMLQQLMESISDLARNRNSGGGNQFMQMLPFLMMMRGQQQAPAPQPAAPPPGDGWIRVA